MNNTNYIFQDLFMHEAFASEILLLVKHLLVNSAANSLDRAETDTTMFFGKVDRDC